MKHVAALIFYRTYLPVVPCRNVHKLGLGLQVDGKINTRIRSKGQYTPETNVLAAARARDMILVIVSMDSIWLRSQRKD